VSKNEENPMLEPFQVRSRTPYAFIGTFSFYYRKQEISQESYILDKPLFLKEIEYTH